ncbi:hypothetical protein DL93DRAFT_2155350 [Clavulina sp. PMI_390]|nr:hypothetical protein DL93DRAFT_2155350 [Clavulina sp. PMI_390]
MASAMQQGDSAASEETWLRVDEDESNHLQRQGGRAHRRRPPPSPQTAIDGAFNTAPPLLQRSMSLQQDVAHYQKIRLRTLSKLPPQLTRSQISMISIGGVIGTGVFLGIAQSLYTGGPLGLFLGYSLVGTMVFAVVVSVAEMVAWLPSVGGGIVALAGLYVDPALGFAMGWNACSTGRSFSQP